MFTTFSQKLNGLFGVDGFPPEAAELLIAVLTQCNAPLEHRGDVTFDGDVTFNGSTNISVTGASYAVATATWIRAAGHGSTVVCRAASTPSGTLTADATPITIYLPRSSQDHDPNVYAGDILQYVTIGGVNYAVGEGYLDAKIGSLKPMTIASAIKGWAKCDGTGATADFTDHFVRGATAYGATGGADSHVHTGTASVASASPGLTGSTGSTSLTNSASGGTTGSNTTGVTVDPHGDHVHDIAATCQVPATGLGAWLFSQSNAQTTGVVDGSHNPAVIDHVGLVVDPGHTHSIGSHTHTISPDPHNHSAGTLAVASHTHTATVSIDSAANIPVYIKAVWYVRVGPAGEIT